MADRDGRSADLPYYIAAVVLLAAAVFLFVQVATEDPEPPAEPKAPETAAPAPVAREAAAPADAPPAKRVRSPAVQVPDQGRLRISADQLREGQVLALGLAMPDALRGEGPVSGKIVDVGGRVLEIEAQPVDGSGSGLRLELEPAWLTPGRYMIQMEIAAGQSPLGVRRYVLEVDASAGDSP